MPRPVLFLHAFLLLAVPMPVAADPLEEILAAAEADCSSFENGAFEPGDAVLEVDLDGQDPIDRIIDSSRFSCSTAASMYCGSGGCSLHAVIGDQSWDFQAEGWRMIDWNGLPILLVARDGGWCGGAGAQICFEAVNWSAGQMMTVMPR
ncbi:hypothetical protein HKCCSP123_02175 [Rhodobacterales bacterium HKCCSP123]|nr:hypothetical protein [Rhodobacterales bacterium HKCCSP123]